MRNGPYILVDAPSDYPGTRYRGKYVYEHHLVWWRATGAVVRDGYVIHHRNEDKHDNRIGNLEEITRSGHSRQHSKEVEAVDVICGQCTKVFSLKPSFLRKRLRASKSGLLYCSRPCQVTQQQASLQGGVNGNTSPC